MLANLDALVDAGHTALIIEHHIDVIGLGPVGGRNGGLIIAQGTPEEVAKIEASHTGWYLREALN